MNDKAEIERLNNLVVRQNNYIKKIRAERDWYYWGFVGAIALAIILGQI